MGVVQYVVQRNSQVGASPVPLHRLSDATLKACSPGNYCDGGGLYLLRQTADSASWYFRYQLHGRRRKMGLGAYPAVSLGQARRLAAKWRGVAAEGRDPLVEREEEIRQRTAKRPTLSTLAERAFEAKKSSLKGEGKAGQWFDPLKLHVLPKLGHYTADALTVSAIVDAFQPIWRVKAPTARKAIQRLDYILKHASASDNAVDVTLVQRARVVLGDPAHIVSHQPALHWRRVPELYQALGRSVAHLGLRFYILTAVRVSNVTLARWSEFSRDVWSLPAERTKSNELFRVPLSWQAKAILDSAKSKFSDGSGYVFPSPTAYKKGVISENTWNKWLQENNWDCVAHGFRSSFRDWCADKRVCDRYLAEMCVAHSVKGKTEKAYWRTDLLDQRAEVMQKWADFVTGLNIHDYAEAWEPKAIRDFEQRQREGKVSHMDWWEAVEDQDEDRSDES